MVYILKKIRGWLYWPGQQKPHLQRKKIINRFLKFGVNVWQMQNTSHYSFFAANIDVNVASQFLYCIKSWESKYGITVDYCY